MNTNTWSCGTPRSQGNAFDIAPRFTPEQYAAQAKAKTRSAIRYEQKLASQGRTRADVQKKGALRVNAEASLAAFVPKSVTAPR
jgi:hypothetical protein